MQAFFEKLHKENIKSTDIIRSVDKTVKKVSEEVTNNTKSQEVSNKHLKDLLLTTQKRIDNEEKQRAKEKRERDRRSADSSPLKGLVGKGDKQKSNNNNTNKKGGGLLDSMLGLGGIASALGSLSAPAILGALGITAIGGTLAAYFTSDKAKEFLDKSIGIPLGKALEQGAKDIFKDTPFAFTPDSDVTNSNIPLTGLDAKSTKNLIEGIVQEVSNDKNTTEEQKRVSEKLLQNITAIEDKRNIINELEKQRDSFQRNIDEAQDYITKTTKEAKDNNRELSGMEKTAIKSYERAIEEYKKDRDDRNTNIRINENQIKSLLTIEANGKKNNELMLTLINQSRERMSSLDGSTYTPLTLDNFKRTGGSIPGDGNGDLVDARLERGEYVLNKNTVKGIGVGNLDRLNFGQMPRFQSGGVVIPDWGAPTPQSSLTKASHPDTGTGWSVGNDAYNRPAVFSKPAAEAFMKVMKESNGIVNPKDIYSSTRTPEKNAAENGAVNSNHLHGNAVDIHGASKVWLKESGTKYGWKNLNYGGHDGHFDFLNGGSLPVQEGSEKTSKDKNNGGLLGNLMGGITGSLPVIGNIIGAFGKGFMEGFGGGEMGQLFSSFLFGGGGSGSGNSPNSAGSGVTGANQQTRSKIAKYALDAGFNREQAKIMAAIAMGESSGNANAFNGDASTGDKSYGLWQINMLDAMGPERRNKWGLSSNEDLFDPMTNARAAKSLFDGRGNFNDWSVYTSGKWKEFYDPALKFNKGGLVPDHKDTVPAMLTPGEYVVPQETVNKVGAGYLRGLDNEINSMFKDANTTKRGQELSGMVMQPIVINNGGGGGGSGLVASEKAESLPTLPNDTGVDFAMDLVMTRHTLSSRIGG